MYFNPNLKRRLNNAKMGETVKFYPAIANRQMVISIIENAGFQVTRISNIRFNASRIAGGVINENLIDGINT